MVLNHLLGDPRHLRRLPCEHVDICLEEGNKREFLFSLRFLVMRVVWEGSAPIWMVLAGPPYAPDDCTFGALEGALALGVEGPLPPSSSRAISAARVCSFSTAASAAMRSPRTVRIPTGDNILRTKYGHELVHGQPPYDGVKREVDLRDVELDVFHAEVFLRPKCNRERYAPEGIHGLRAHPEEWARGPQPRPRDLQMSECCMADDIEADPSVDQHVM
jgi:hypothetical protein